MAGTPSRRVTMRVWVALPKKAALYTMKTPSEQCLTPTEGTPCRRYRQPKSLKAHARHDQDPRRAGKDARRRPPRRRSPRHDRRARAARRDDRGTRPDLPRLHRQRAEHDPGQPELPRLPEDHLHLGQPRGLPRHPQRQAPEGRRHRQHRRHGHPDGFHGDTSRMYSVGKPPPQAERLAETCFEAMWQRHRGGAPRGAPRRHRARHPDLRRAARLLGGARVLRPRHRPRLPRRPAGAALRRAGHRACSSSPA